MITEDALLQMNCSHNKKPTYVTQSCNDYIGFWPSNKNTLNLYVKGSSMFIVPYAFISLKYNI